MAQAAIAYNSTILKEKAEDDDNDNDGGVVGCNIVATSRVYDPEAEDVFGAGYFSLQVQVSQRIVVESTNQTLYLEVVQSVIEKGFDVVSGGQLEFRNNLYENSSYESVLSVRVRRGLTAPMVPPTPKPTSRPISAPPTKSTNCSTNRPTNRPTKWPTSHPTNMPSDKPTRRPTPRPTRRPTPHPTSHPTWSPTLDPSDVPSHIPSPRLSKAPKAKPTRSPSQNPSLFPSVSRNSNVHWNPSDEHSFLANRNSVVVASILGGSVLLATIFCLVCLFCYKYQTNSRRYSHFRSPVPLSQKHSHAVIPGFVEVGDDQQSLADTTLESPITGATKRRKRPSFRKGLGNSFDENSLYTTPFPYDDEPEQRATAIPPPLPLPSVRSSFSSTLMTPLEYEERIVFPPSESISDDEHNASGEGVELQLRNRRSTGPIDLDTSDLESSVPYDEKHHKNNTLTKITKIKPLAAPPKKFAFNGNDDFSRIPSDLDVWSGDFQDFDRSSEFYKAEESSTSLSSSASTKRINNIILPSKSTTSSTLTLKSKKKDLDSKPIMLPPTIARSRNSLSKISGIGKSSIKPRPTISRQNRENENDHKASIQPPSALSQKARERKPQKVVIQPPKTQPQRVREKENNLNASQKPSLPSKLNPNIKNSSTPLFLLQNKNQMKGKSDPAKEPKIVSPEENSLASKQAIRSKKAIILDTPKATKAGASTAAMDYLANGSGLIVRSLKDGVTTINETGNGVVKSAAPKIDKLTHGIVESIRVGAPHIENVGNGLVSSLTDIFDRMAIPKITPEEHAEDASTSLASESTFTINRRAPIDLSLSNTVSDDDSGVSASPWLMDKVEKTLGPKSEHADLASLNSHKSPLRRSQYGSEVSYGSSNTLGIRSMSHNGSEASFGSKRSYNYHRNRKRGNGTEVSFGSRSSRYSQYSKPDLASIMSKASASMSADIVAQETPGEISFAKPSRAALEEKKKRLEQQLAQLDGRDSSSVNNENKETASSVTMSSVTWGSFATIASRNRTFRDRRQVIVCVPPGKLGVILADQHDGNGTVINSIRGGSPVERILKPGDKLIAVDDIAVVGMTCSQITSLIASRADQERRFTVMTTIIKKKKSIIEEAAAAAANSKNS